ncbi:GNAT family N-acetyltransferase [Catenuloplanes atrovinosus]|uniref:GNAT superfamily N-acetyltransferase n=1 Tax=Catenuloplanes atrovinosus TaxID=137266 RepID=A0AAE3YMN7_9ACTN|nr:GNAT family N-acetyltransferase [Catenuloplanes atrovinosus]MDR7275305.1 GNAT superfamily N-acetyltransferase [Catenuloplanes atrovinosus]
MTVRPWQADDYALLSGFESHLSAETVWRRFFTGGSALPAAYRRMLLRQQDPAAPPWLMQVTVADGHLVGWAECRGGPAHGYEVAVIVADPWQRNGIGTRLLRELLGRCAEAGIDEVRGYVLPGNPAMAGAVRHRSFTAADGAHWTVSHRLADGLREHVLHLAVSDHG